MLVMYENYVAQRGKAILEKLGNSVAKVSIIQLTAAATVDLMQTFISWQDPKSYVELLLELHNKFYALNKDTFSSNSTFTAAVDKAFRTIVNDTTTNPNANGPEILARYCDMMLKRSAGKKEAASSAAGASGKAGTRRRLTVGADDSDPTETLTRMVRVVPALVGMWYTRDLTLYSCYLLLDYIVQVH